MRRKVIKRLKLFVPIILIIGVCCFTINVYANVVSLSVVDPYEPLTRFPRLSLTDNTIKDADGNWVTSDGVFHNEWSSYNCYAYAIHMPDGKLLAGFMNDEGYSPASTTVQEIAQLAKADLE